MADPAPPPTERPFQVWVVGGSVHSGYGSKDAAEKRVEVANAAAEALGLVTRYEVRTNDG